MKIEESYQRQDELNNLLYELASAPIDDSHIDGMVAEFKTIYSDGFRHNYSRFFPLVVDIFKEDNEYSQDYLCENLQQIRIVVEKDYFDNEDKDNCKYVGLYMPLTKLADHINLEIARYSQNYQYENKIKDIEKRSQTVQEQLKASKSELKKTNKKLQSAQKEYIAILGIFSAVVLAFTGGIAFSTSVLENIHKASIYRTTFICVIIAFVLTNILYMLFKYIEKIVHGPSTNSKFIEHLPIVIVDAVIAIAVVIIFVLWFFGGVEKRNERIQDHHIAQTESMEEPTSSTVDTTDTSKISA